jgi:ankyrin repeat protein
MNRSRPPTTAERQIFLAVHRGDCDAVRKLLLGSATATEEARPSSPDVNVTDEAGFTPLKIAILQGRTDMVERLLALGATATAAHAHYAVDEQQWEILPLLVLAGADPLVHTRRGNLLHLAVLYGHAPTVRWLLSHASAMLLHTHTLRHEYTALHLASYWRRTGVVQDLVEWGAVPAARDRWQRNCLHVAVQVPTVATGVSAPEVSPVLLKVLLNAQDGLLEQVDMHGQTPLHLACQHMNVPAVQVLLEEGANIFVKDCLGRSSFYYAAVGGDPLLQVMVDCLESREQAKQDPPSEEDTGRIVAANIATALNQADVHGWTVLHHIAWCQQPASTLARLLALGANPRLVNNQQQTPLHLVGSGMRCSPPTSVPGLPPTVEVSTTRRREASTKPLICLDPSVDWHAQYKHAMAWLSLYSPWFVQHPPVQQGWPRPQIPAMVRLDACTETFALQVGQATDNARLLLDHGAAVLVRDVQDNLPFGLAASTGNVSEVFDMLRIAAHEGLFDLLTSPSTATSSQANEDASSSPHQDAPLSGDVKTCEHDEDSSSTRLQPLQERPRKSQRKA